MTAIVALVHNGKVHMAGDSFCGSETQKNLCKEPKVYKVGALGVGLCGMVRQELILEKTIRKAIETDGIVVTHKWIKFELPDLIADAFEGKSATVEDRSQITMGESAYMIAFDGRIYYLDDDFGIWESQRPIAAIGIGKQYALGALSVNMKLPYTTPEEMLTGALEIAHEWSIWVEPPYRIITV